MTVGPEDFLQRIEESGLLSDSIVEQKERLRAATSVEDAAADLVSQKLLTAYQSEVLLSGEDVPLVLGDYVVTESIGRGGMGYVLKARHRRMKRTVAIKFLLKSLTESDDLRRRFEREVEAAAQLDHQNIVTAYDAGVHEGSHYLVMQYVDGDDLSHIVKSSGPLDIPDAVDVIRQAALGLGYAHERGIVHRDIKPGNLLLDNEGVVRILDMGLARMTPSPGDELEGGAQADLTNTGSVMGTIDYMAPEQALDAKSVDHRADIYALGCTLYFLLTSNPPFRNETVMRRLLAHREQPAPKISAYRPDAPRELDEIFATMMAKSPDDRYPSMKHLVVALDSLGLNDSEAGQMATLDVPDDGNGGFVGLPGYDASANSESATLPPTSPQSGKEPSTGVSRSLSVSDVTILETPSNVSALNTLADVEPAPPAGTSDTDSTGFGETIIHDSQSVAGAAAARAAKSPLSWKLFAPIGLAVVALIVFLVSRPDPVAEDEEPGKPASVAVTPQDDTPSDNSQRLESSETQSPDRHAAEAVLKLGGTVWVGSNFQQIVDPADLPIEHFVVTKIDLSEKKNIEDKFLANLRGLADLEILILTETSITDRGLANLTDEGRQPLPSLQRLYLDSTNVSQTGLQFLSGSHDLIGLLLDRTATTEGAVLDQFPKLAMLGLGYTEFTTDELQALLTKFPQINYLTMDGRHMSETMIATLANVAKLRVLKLRGLSSDFDPGGLAKLPLLTELYLDADDSTVFDEDFWTAVAGLGKLHILMCKGLSDEALAKARPTPQVEVFFVMSKVVTAEAVVKSMSKFPNVKSLSVNYSDWTDDDVQQLHCLKSLGKLDLTKNSASVEAIKALSVALPKCQIISDHGTFGPTVAAMNPDRHAAEVVLRLGGSVIVRVDSGEKLRLGGGMELPAGTFVVTEIDLASRPDVDDQVMTDLQGLSELQALFLPETSITDRGLANLTDEGRIQLPALKRIYLSATPITEEGLSYLNGSSDLEGLLLPDTKVVRANVLRQFPKLNMLSVAGCPLEAGSLSVVQALPNLARLEIDGEQFSKAAAGHIADLKQLQHVVFSNVTAGFDANALAMMSPLTNLGFYNPDPARLDETFWGALASLPNLSNLYFIHRVTDEALAGLHDMPQLTIFGVTSKEVSGQAVAAALSKMPNVTNLQTRFLEWDDEDIKPLHDSKSLRRIEIDGNYITVEGVTLLRSNLPACWIKSDHGTFEPTKSDE